jgi:hypothetical protein
VSCAALSITVFAGISVRFGFAITLVSDGNAGASAGGTLRRLSAENPFKVVIELGHRHRKRTGRTALAAIIHD